MQWYEEVIQTLLIGITNGAIISLVALGYTLVYGIIELINFAHGDVFMIGTMVSLTILTVIPPLLGARQAFQLQPAQIAILLVVCLFASAGVCALLNVVIERLAYRRLRNAPRLAPLISAIGVSFILVNIGLVWKGASPVNFPNLLPPVDVLRDVFGVDTLVQFRLKDVFVLIVAVPLMIALQLFVQRTRLGKAMRATAQDRQAASMMGIDINLTIALTFLLGGALAGLCRSGLRPVQQLGVVLSGLPRRTVCLYRRGDGRHWQHSGRLHGGYAHRDHRRHFGPHHRSEVD